VKLAAPAKRKDLGESTNKLAGTIARVGRERHEGFGARFTSDLARIEEGKHRDRSHKRLAASERQCEARGASDRHEAAMKAVRTKGEGRSEAAKKARAERGVLHDEPRRIGQKGMAKPEPSRERGMSHVVESSGAPEKAA